MEAKLTVQQTHDYWLNYMREEYKAEQPPPGVVAFMLHQQEWLRAQMMDSANDGDEYWEAMKLVMAQWDGFAQGIGQFATPEQLAILSPASLYLLCSVGDLETINGLVKRAPLPVPSLETEDHLPCSALISVQTTADGKGVSDIFASQATWRSYYAMLRIYKIYAFDFYPQKVVTIASSPGALAICVHARRVDEGLVAVCFTDLQCGITWQDCCTRRMTSYHRRPYMLRRPPTWSATKLCASGTGSTATRRL
eukprot:COSAG02_NODE_997_length_15333_cov_13.688526_3_plen_252_part_00